ncbi:MAG TPA: hypothetical protein VK369_16835, partial [Segetibacter sp.]|nr:hypothetical protein [Segetibacter sp.]
KELAYQQSKRYFIERNFQDTKQQLGLDDYQCQLEIAWERHMSLCMLAMLFINREKCENLQELDIYLTVGDINKMIMAIVLYNENKQQRIFKEILTKTQMTKLRPKRMFILEYDKEELYRNINCQHYLKSVKIWAYSKVTSSSKLPR